MNHRSGLAPIITKELFARLAELNRTQGVTMLIVEQNANIALGIAHRGYVMETGRVTQTGSADDLRHDEGVRRAYLGV
jgi:branched-chain amino acid transport system ATP-binding protein